MQDASRFLLAPQVRGLRRSLGGGGGGGISWTLETRGGVCCPGMPFSGRARVPMPGCLCC